MTENQSRPGGVAFLLTQLGTHAAARFADRVAEHDLTPPQCGVLGLLRARSDLSQQELADLLGMLPSSVVPLVDGLEQAGFVQRVRSETDRRRNELRLTADGEGMLQTIGRIGRAHDNAISASLSRPEREQLRGLLERIADEQGLTPGVHPGYRSLRPAAARR